MAVAIVADNEPQGHRKVKESSVAVSSGLVALPAGIASQELAVTQQAVNQKQTPQ